MTVTIENLYTGNGATTNYSFTFPYLDDTDIKASLDGTVTTNFRLLNATTVQFVNNTTANTPTAPNTGVAIRIYRETAFTNPKATFYPGSAIRANDLNDNTLQNLYVNQESNDKVADAWLSGDPTVISTEAWHTSDDTKVATTKAIENRIGAKIDTAMEADVLAGTDLTKTASGGQVTINHSVTGAASVDNSNGSVIQDLTINGRGHVTGTGSINLDTRYYTETELDAGQLDNRYYTETELNAGQLDNRYFTETELTGGALDGRYFTETEADARYYRLGSTEEIQSGETWAAADNKVATTAAIDARITDLVDDVGGFVPIANETSFPNANPDVNNGAGTLISIKALSGNLTSNGSGVATISNGTLGNSTVTINGLENSTTYAATLGMIVETTSTLNTYTFHRVTPKATEVTTVAGSISNINTVATNISDVNNFADLYQIATSAPSTDGGGNSLATGDLWFDSSSNKTLKVHNGTAFQAVSPTQSVLQDISIVSGQITFTEDLGAITDSLATGTGNNINTVASGIANVNTVAGISSNVTTVAGIASSVSSVASSIANVNTAASNLASINNFGEVYRIASSAPTSSLNEGDLWYDSTGNSLKYYNGTTWTVTAAAGLSNIVEDTTPELGGHLDCNDKNLTEVGTVSGDNLQIDFGTL